MRITALKPGVTTEYGVSVPVSTVVTVGDEYGKSLVLSGLCADTDSVLPNPVTTTVRVVESRAITPLDDQQVLQATAASVVLTLPEGLSPMPAVIVLPHSSGTSIDPAGATTLNGAGTTLSATTGAICIIPESTANAYRVTGAA